MRSLDEKYKLLGPWNTQSFQHVDSTPPFSALIADLAFRQLLEGKQEKLNKVWDPYCGNGIITRTVSVLHRDRVQQIIASDIRSEAIKVTRYNLSRCSTQCYEKNDSFRKLLEEEGCKEPVDVLAFKHDATKDLLEFKDESVDILVTDPHYEHMEAYFESLNQSLGKPSEYLSVLLHATRPKLKDGSRIGLILDQGEDYSEILDNVSGYQSKYKKLLNKFYKNRILYFLQGVG